VDLALPEALARLEALAQLLVHLVAQALVVVPLEPLVMVVPSTLDPDQLVRLVSVRNQQEVGLGSLLLLLCLGLALLSLSKPRLLARGVPLLLEALGVLVEVPDLTLVAASVLVVDLALLVALALAAVLPLAEVLARQLVLADQLEPGEPVLLQVRLPRPFKRVPLLHQSSICLTKSTRNCVSDCLPRQPHLSR
jgi:hypothetical protein